MAVLVTSPIIFIVFSAAFLSIHAATDIRLPPSILGSPLDDNGILLYYETEETITLKCDASGTPEPKVDWFKNGKKVNLNANNIEKLGDGSLYISPMTSLDEGSYYCTASNVYGKAMSIAAELERAALGRYPPSAVQTYTADEGDFLMIPCQEVKSVPLATYNWAIADSEDDENPQNLDTDERLVVNPQGYLYIANVMIGDMRADQLYKCNVFNPTLDVTVGGSYARVIVNPVANVGNKPPVLQFPKSSETKDVIAVLYDHFELKCIFSGRPAPKVTWKKVGSALPGGRYDDTLETGTMLQVNNVQWEDQAEYVCTGTNQAGSKTYTITVDVQSKPTFVPADSVDEGRVLKNQNVTEGKKAEFFCEAEIRTEPAPDITFMINAKELDDDFPGPRRTITKISNRPGKILTIENVCKDCEGGGTDLMGIQCRIRNDHGVVFKSVYLNVLLAVSIAIKPESVTLSPEVVDEGFVSFHCAPKADGSTNTKVIWRRDDEIIIPDKDDRITIDEKNTLTIDITDLEEKGAEYAGTYTCFATNGYSEDFAEAKLYTPDGAVVAPIASASMFDMWWIFLIVAAILLLLILLLCCCLCCQRNRGDSYPVDEKERKDGRDPEKELADSGFQDYQRPEDEPVKGSRASLTSTIKLDSDDEGSLNEYGDIDTGKFNEDGSFIGQYMNDKKKKRAYDSTV